MKEAKKNVGNEQGNSQSMFDTRKAMTKSNAIEIPTLELPKGGGAIKGIDEKFSVNSVNGTASFSVPLPFSSSRGIAPSLALSYSSGSGNGNFGLGWSIGLGSIKRKTENELPSYEDGIDSDTFMLSGAEDLVPVFKKDEENNFLRLDNGDFVIDDRDSGDGLCKIRLYRPRTEGMFARIERWTEKSTGVIRWRILSKNNVTSLYGWTQNARLCDPADELRIFEWFPEFVFDDKGNCTYHVYKQEDGIGLNPSDLHQRNRIVANGISYANLYLEKILYGNKTPYGGFGETFPAEDDYLFSTIFDYGEYDLNSPYAKINDWDFRTDAFSVYKSGFEIRTTRLCRRILLFHHFNGPNEYSGLVRSLDLEHVYGATNFAMLKSITSVGYCKQGDGSYSHKKFPPVEFKYQEHEWNTEVRTIQSEDLVHAPSGLSGSEYQFADLFNEGLSGILTEQGNGWYYKHNLGDGKFAQAKQVSPKPAMMGLNDKLKLIDLDADGTKQIVSYNPALSGYFELDDDNEWKVFKSFNELPTINFDDTNGRMIDLNGDGKPEFVMTGQDEFLWYSSKGREGYLPAKKSAMASDEELGPQIVFSDARQSVFLADMSGDGLTDIVRIRNGEVCYWPNLGYGKFGAKIAMDNAPTFDHPEAFNPSYIQLADIDGSGTTDIIYLGKNSFTCWMNHSGNAFGVSPVKLPTMPELHSFSKVTVADLLGNGVACVVWSSGLAKDAATSIRYVDLMNSKKPHIISAYKNNLGKEVSFEYTSSTRFYLDDKAAGNPWVTKLHFPVHCLSKVESRDMISGYRFVSSFKYHHGYYDHAEREFRGFGRVDQIDAEHFDHWVKGNATNIVEAALHQDPVVAKTWFHTGSFERREKILDQFSQEYWFEEMKRLGFNVTHPEVDLPDAAMVVADGTSIEWIENMSVTEWQQALRACKGMTLRSEVFTEDAPLIGATPSQIQTQLTPYSVATRNCAIELLQPKGQNKFAVFVIREREGITYNYERNPADPRIGHTLNIKADEYGNVLEAASVVYPRLVPDATLPAETQAEQAKTIVTYASARFTNDVIGENVYRQRIASETKAFELKGVAKSGAFYSIADFENILVNSDEVSYHEIDVIPTPGTAQRRLVEHTRTLYRGNDLTSQLPLHQLESFAIPYQNFQLAFTPELIANIYGAKVTSALLTDAKYIAVEGDQNWWIRSGQLEFINEGESASAARDRFYSPIAFIDPYGAKSNVTHYGNYFLMIEQMEDALGNKAKVDVFNFRTLSPQRMKDINGNFTESIADELGCVKAMALFGKGNQADDLTGFEEATGLQEASLVSDFFNAPDSVSLRAIGKDLLQHASSRFVYDLDSYRLNGSPIVVSTIVREQHFQTNNDSPIQVSFEYSNGLGQIIMKKTPASPGLAKVAVVQADNSISITEVDTAASNPPQLRWVGNGRTILNNKGNPVKKYEPYFSTTPRFEDAKGLVETGVTPIMYYDALGRSIRTERPDGTLTKVDLKSWAQLSYDPNDTILETTWYVNRTNQLIDAQLIAEGKNPLMEKAAADKSAKHANTPSEIHFDTLGRPILTIGHNKNVSTDADEYYRTTVKVDTEGNLRQVNDARNNVIITHKYDMLGRMVYQDHMDSGKRWQFFNNKGKPIRNWDERGFEFQYFYDIAQRATYSKVLNGDDPAPLDNIISRTVYGESLLLPDRSNEAVVQQSNVLGNVIRHYDTAGMVESPVYDFKGKSIVTTRTLSNTYKGTVNWIDANLVSDLESDGFPSTIQTDALGRIAQVINPDGSTVIPTYSENGLLMSESIVHSGDTNPVIYIKRIDYNEKAQRTRIVYGNDVQSRFFYDRLTFRLNRLETKRQNNDPLQDWYYTYDPMGNITHIEDRNIPVTFFNNQKATGVSEYTYDALYRLVSGTGRENNSTLVSNSNDNWNDLPYLQQLNAGDPMLVRNYTQRYQYDEVGNILQMQHIATGNSWTRDYQYESTSNCLVSTSVGGNVYTYPRHAQHGYMMVMPHLEEIAWNFKEELAKSVKQKVNPTTGTAETTYYQYDGQGQRVRKVTENFTASGGVPTKKEERIYQGGFETYRRFTANAVSFERESVSLIDMGNRFVMIETVALNSAASPSPSEMVGARMVRHHLHNHLGSAALELDQNGLVISYEEYHPFGTTSYRAKNQAIEVSERRYRYTGKERDDETGLYYHGARYYIPWLARWMSSDPIVLGDGVNTFCYCSNNPINLLDPSGKDSGDWYNVETEDPRATYKQNAVTGDVIRHEPGRLEVWKETGTPGQYVAVYTEMVFPEDTLIANQSTMPPPLEPPPPPEPDPETPTPEDDSAALETAADVVTDFIPFVGSGKDLYRGIRDGDGWGIAFGIGGLALDVVTLGSGSIVKGAAKTGAKQVAKQVIKQEAKQLIKQEAKQIIKTEAKEIVEQEAKSVLKEEVETVVKKEGKEAVEQAVKKGTPGELGTLVGTSRDQMRRAARNKIAEARKAGGKHPLDFLLDADGNFKTVTSRKHSNLIDNPDVLEMGHITSNKAGGPERIMLQTAYDNQFNNWAAEGLRKGGKDLGVFVENVAIDIGGIAVDLKSAEWWVKLGWLSEDVVKNAPRLVF